MRKKRYLKFWERVTCGSVLTRVKLLATGEYFSSISVFYHFSYRKCEVSRKKPSEITKKNRKIGSTVARSLKTSIMTQNKKNIRRSDRSFGSLKIDILHSSKRHYILNTFLDN